MSRPYPVAFHVEYPDRELSRAATLVRPILAIPICWVLLSLSAVSSLPGSGLPWPGRSVTAALLEVSGGTLFVAPLLMLLFRQKYPRWWFDWNLELQRFQNRVLAYLALMSDEYPSTTDRQSVDLMYPFPEDGQLNRWLPLVKWVLVLPHLIVLIPLMAAAVLAVFAAWVNILFTGVYPRPLFEFVEGVLRWYNRVFAYSLVLVTDAYPPFRLSD